MTPEDHLRILGPAYLAEIRRKAAAAPAPTPEVAADLRQVLAPAMARVRARRSAAAEQATAA
jgi:hypothetical protein